MPYPSWLSFLPTVTALAALILTTLCLFAGTQKNFFMKADILTIHTPDVGNDAGIHDFYSVYVMSYCEGFLDRSLTNGSSTSNIGRNVTGCSDRTLPFAFNPDAVLSSEVSTGVSLSSLGWPSAISDDFNAFVPTSQTMAVLYVIGAGVTGLAIFIRLWLTLTRGPRQSATELAFLLAGFFSLGIASVIASVIAIEFVDLVNRHGQDSGVSADHGTQFLGMTWAAVGLSFIGSLGSLIMIRIDRAQRSEPLPPPEEPKPPPAED